MTEEAGQAPRRRVRMALLALLVLVAVALVTIWLARKPIAANFIDRELARRGVPARYAVKRIGLRTQRLEGVSIGDARAPDLTADWVEVDLRPTLGAPQITEIRARGVRLRGRLADGRLRLGTVDRLLPAPTGAPFRLPDLPVALVDARLALATPAGPISLRLDGQGNLANGFAGRYAAIAPELAVAGCRLSATRFAGRITTQRSSPRFVGPLAAKRVDCDAGVEAAATAGTIDATLQPALDGWRGSTSLAGSAITAADWSASGARVRIAFDGDARRTFGSLRMTGSELDGPPARAPHVELGGRYVVEPGPTTGIRFQGRVSAKGLALADAPRLDTVATSVAGTPLQPLAEALARAVGGLTRASDLRASLNLAARGDAGSARIDSADLAGSEAQLRFIGREGFRLAWPSSAQTQLDGRLELSGRGIPRVVADLRQSAPGAPLSGLARIEPFVAGGSRVAFTPVRFEADRFRTVIEASGPLAGGRVERATLALDGGIGAGGLFLNPSCAALSFQRLTIAGLDLRAATLRLCPAGPALVTGGRVAGSIESPRLQGTLGSGPVTLAARRARFDNAGFRIAQLEARLGGADRLSRLDIVELSGAPRGGLTGRFAGASGQIGRVPLIASDAAGRWRWGQGVLTVSGGLTLSDQPDPPRFNPLVSRDSTLRIAGRALTASGTLLEPASGNRVAQVALAHDLTGGDGGADIDVASVRFDRGLQPEQITRLTLGVIADLRGTLSGKGRIDWNPTAVTSSGLFRVDASSLSAPFGPVTGVAADIRFTDLLNLVTAPDQTLTVATVNPGILVEEGIVRYRIVPGFRVAIESARWPFAGGELTLRPTELDFSADAARNLTFDVAGLDAAKFINKLEFDNISATGLFDGALPMVFDQDGGRIVGGALASRDPGGTLAYVGEVSNADLGIWGGIAFDALKSIAYRNMTIGLDGKIDGEMVSQIRFNGVSRGTIQPVATGLIARIGGRLASQLQRLPFIFNIRISAPFRGLIATGRSFYDPSGLIAEQLGPGFEPAPLPVQPLESETKR